MKEKMKNVHAAHGKVCLWRRGTVVLEIEPDEVEGLIDEIRACLPEAIKQVQENRDKRIAELEKELTLLKAKKDE